MQVGFGSGFTITREDASDGDFVREEFELCVLAEELGFDSVWITEHHFTGYCLTPDPVQMLTYIAGRTKRIKLGTHVIVLPWHDPVRLAEQIIMLDHVSDGRFILGLGRGFAQSEYDGLRIDKNQARVLFNEYAELITNALETGFIEGGEITRQPRRELRPRPYRSFKGRMYGAPGSPESLNILARFGLGLMVVQQKPGEQMRSDLETYARSWRETFGADSEPPKPLVTHPIFVDQSADRAVELAHKYITANFKKGLNLYKFDEAHLNVAKGYESYAKLGEEMAKVGVDKIAEGAVALSPHGTPQQILEYYERQKRDLNMIGVNPMFTYGGMPSGMSEASMRLFAREVLPELQRW